jgi:hypothetical protein
MIRTRLDAIPAIRKSHPTACDTFLIGDAAQTARLFENVNPQRDSRKSRRDPWSGNQTFDESLAHFRNGNPALVPASDAYLEKLTDRPLVSRRWQIVPSVAGGAPNVPAMLSGHPLAMFRRQRIASDQAPLAIIVDVASSAGIGTRDLERRGAAILALVRMLSASRAVSLYVGVSVTCGHLKGDRTHDATHIFTRCDTAPLDLARLAHMLGQPSTARRLYYGAAYEAEGAPTGDHSLFWPYLNGPSAIREHAHAILSRAIPDACESLYIGAAHISDEAIKSPEQWLDDMMTRHGGAPVTEAA